MATEREIGFAEEGVAVVFVLQVIPAGVRSRGGGAGTRSIRRRGKVKRHKIEGVAIDMLGPVTPQSGKEAPAKLVLGEDISTRWAIRLRHGIGRTVPPAHLQLELAVGEEDLTAE